MAWSERVDLRILTGKHFQDGNKFRYEQYAKTRLHYPTAGVDSTVLDGVVDMVPMRVSNAQLDGWMVTVSSWHYALGMPKMGALANLDGVVGFGGRQGQNWFKFRLVRSGYMKWSTREWGDLSGAPDYARTRLTRTTQALMVGPTGATQSINALTTATWADIWPALPSGQVDVTWHAEGRELKEEIKVTQAAREWIATNRPPSYFFPGVALDDAYFGFVFRLDWSDIPKIYRGTELKSPDDDYTDDGEIIYLKDALDRLLEFMPIDVCRVGETETNTRIRKRFYKDTDGNNYLLMGIRCDLLNSLPAGDLIFDPTFIDGYGGDVSTYKDTKFNPYSPGNNYGIVNNYFTGSEGGGSGLIQFNVSSIPAGSTCDSATFYNYHMAVGSSMAWTAMVYAVAVGNDGWPEGTHANEAGGAGDSCYSYKDQAASPTAWAGSAGCNTSGTDYEASSIGSFTGNRADPIGTGYSTLLTAARVAAWFGSPNTNYGMKLISATNDIGALCSSDYATTGYRPKLVVVYTAAGGDATVEAVSMTATAQKLVSTITGGAAVAAALSTTTGQSLAPQAIGGANVAGVLGTASGELLTPAAIGGANVAGVVGTATGQGLAPTAAGGANVAGAVGIASGEILTPGVTGGANVAGVVGTTSGQLLAPAVAGGVNISGEVGTANGQSLAPEAIGGANVTGIIANASGESLAPAAAGGANISGEVGVATGQALNPAVTGSGDASVAAVTLTALAQSFAPAIMGEANLAAVTSTASAESFAPTITGEASLAAVTSTATARELDPIISGGAAVSVVVSVASGEAVAPVAEGGASISGVIATAAGLMLAPTVSGVVVANVGAVTMTAAASFQAPTVSGAAAAIGMVSLTLWERGFGLTVKTRTGIYLPSLVVLPALDGYWLFGDGSIISWGGNAGTPLTLESRSFELTLEDR